MVFESHSDLNAYSVPRLSRFKQYYVVFIELGIEKSRN
jgi:hypothetical protein